MNKLCSLLFAVTLLSVAACSGSQSAATTKASEKTVEGTWSTLVAGTPAGDVPAVLNITKEGDMYKGTIATAGGSPINLENVKVVGNKLSASFYSSEYGTDIYFTTEYKPDSDTLDGWVMDNYKMTGKRKMADN